MSLSVDGMPVASGHPPRLLFIISTQGMDIGRSLSAVNADYSATFACAGEIKRVVFEAPRTPSAGEVKAQVRTEMSRQ